MCRKHLDVDKTVGQQILTGQTVTIICLLVTGQPAYRRQELYTGFYLEQEKLLVDVQKLCGKSLSRDDGSTDVLLF